MIHNMRDQRMTAGTGQAAQVGEMCAGVSKKKGALLLLLVYTTSEEQAVHIVHRSVASLNRCYLGATTYIPLPVLLLLCDDDIDYV